MSCKLFLFFLAPILSVVFCINAIPDAVLAQEKYPTKPITLTIGYGAGGGTDVSTRPLANAASKILGQPIIVVNKPGGATAVAMAALKNEKPDGYNIGTLGAGGFLVPLTRKVGYDVLKDFTPIIQFAIFQYGLVVRSDSPWKTFKEFIDYAKANPGKIRYSTSGVGGAQHLVMERLALAELANFDIAEDSRTKYNLQQSIKATHRARDLVQQILAFSLNGPSNVSGSCLLRISRKAANGSLAPAVYEETSAGGSKKMTLEMI
jgi:hypothetical protein